MGGPSSGAGPGRRSDGGDAGELAQKNITAAGLFSRPPMRGSEDLRLLFSATWRVEKTLKQVEKKNPEDPEARLAQPFLLPVLFPLIYCQITDIF